jgi:hypothetical protein
VVRNASSTTWGSTAKAKPGQLVYLSTSLPSAVKTSPKPVQIKISAGPATALTATANWNGHSSTVKVSSPGGKPVTVAHVQYVCTLPPSPTFCPAKKISSSKQSFQLQFAKLKSTVVQLEALIGPVTTPPTVVHTSGTSVVPTYKPTQAVEAITPPAKGAPKGTKATSTGAKTSVAVKPKDEVVMISHLTGGLVGATQGLTVKVQQGPAPSLKVSAQVAGGQTATATVTSANGKPITLVLPHYVCFTPPSRTFCPAKKIHAANHAYQLMFLASPYTPAIVLTAVAQSG